MRRERRSSNWTSFSSPWAARAWDGHEVVDLAITALSLRSYEVLKAAKFRCELCGVSAEERALQVDHIVPRNHGASDEIVNLQALCYICNAMKGDKDSTDF